MTEYALVAFSFADNDGRLVWWSPGGALEAGVRYNGNSAVEIGLIPYRNPRDRLVGDDWPECGLAVWEGTGTPHGEEIAYQGRWRQPTDDEWADIKANENPWGRRDVVEAA